jgi:hypothetical protein
MDRRTIFSVSLILAGALLLLLAGVAASSEKLTQDRAEKAASRIEAGFPVQGAIRYSPDGRFVFMASRNGLIRKFDLTEGLPVAEARAGTLLRNFALSSDGKWLMAGNSQPQQLVVLHANDLGLFKVIPVADVEGRTSAVNAVYNSPARQAFLVTLQSSPEILELSYDPEAAPVYGSFVHSYRKGHVEAVIVEEQPFARNRLKLKVRLEDVFLDPYGAEIVGLRAKDDAAVVYNLDARRKIAELQPGGNPHFGAGLSWIVAGQQILAVPDLDQPVITIIDMESWTVIKKLKMRAPGYFLHPVSGSRTHSGIARFRLLSGPDKGQLQIIDKQTLEVTGLPQPDRNRRSMPGHIPLLNGKIIFGAQD